MNNKFFLMIGLFFQSCFVFSSDSNISTEMIQGVPVEVVYRLENEVDENGFRRDSFVPAEGDDKQRALDNFEKHINLGGAEDLVGAKSVTLEVDYQNGMVYATLVYPDNSAFVDGFPL